MQRMHTSMLRKTRMSTHCWPAREWVQRYHARSGRVENPWWELKRQLYGRRKAAKKFNEFVVTATDGLGIEHYPEQPSPLQTARNHIDFLSVTKTTSTCQRALWNWRGSRESGCKAQLKPAEPMGPGSQYSYLRARRTRIDADTIHDAPRETYIKNILDILRLGDHKCKPMPTPIVQIRQKSDENEPRLGDGDRRSYHRCVGIQRHLLKCRPRHSIRSPRGQQDARIARRCRPPKIATTWQVSLTDTEAWKL